MRAQFFNVDCKLQVAVSREAARRDQRQGSSQSGRQDHLCRSELRRRPATRRRQRTTQLATGGGVAKEHLEGIFDCSAAPLPTVLFPLLGAC